MWKSFCLIIIIVIYIFQMFSSLVVPSILVSSVTIFFLHSTTWCTHLWFSCSFAFFCFFLLLLWHTVDLLLRIWCNLSRNFKLLWPYLCCWQDSYKHFAGKTKSKKIHRNIEKNGGIKFHASVRIYEKCFILYVIWIEWFWWWNFLPIFSFFCCWKKINYDWIFHQVKLVETERGV